MLKQDFLKAIIHREFASEAMNIGIIGQGFVGNAVFQKFRNFYKTYTYDLDDSKCNSNLSFIAKNCNIIFVCVPTPMNTDGSCDISIVDSVINQISKEKVIVVNKSTVPPGSTELFNDKYKNIQVVFFNPEFLTERNAIDDYKNQNRIILGGPRACH